MSNVIRTPICRLAFANVLSPVQTDHGDRYKAVLIFNEEAQKTPAFKKLKAAADKAAKDKWGDKLPAKMRSPFKEADEFTTEDGERYQGFEDGCIGINVTSKSKPKIVDRNVDPIIEDGEVYSGMYVYASLNAYAYEKNGKGISFGLNNIQKVRDGERLGGGPSSPEDDFEVLDDEEGTEDDIF